MICIALCLVLLQPAGPDAPPTAPPVQGVARLDAKGSISIACVTPVPGLGRREVPLPAGDRGDAKDADRARIAQWVVTVTKLPARAVRAYTADGKPVAAAKLAELLAKDRVVLIAVDGKKVDPFLLQLYKEDTLILVPPAHIDRLRPAGDDLPPQDIPSPKEPQPKKDQAAAPDVPAPDSPGDIGLALRMPGKIGSTTAVGTIAPQNGKLVLTRLVVHPVAQAHAYRVNIVEQVPVTEVYEVKTDGRIEKRQHTRFVAMTKQVTRTAMEIRAEHRAVKHPIAWDAIKAYVVTKEGTLEELPPMQLKRRFTKPTAVLSGEADVTPRQLALIRAGTLYVVIPPGTTFPYGREPIPVPKRPAVPDDGL